MAVKSTKPLQSNVLNLNDKVILVESKIIVVIKCIKGFGNRIFYYGKNIKAKPGEKLIKFKQDFSGKVYKVVEHNCTCSKKSEKSPK